MGLDWWKNAFAVPSDAGFRPTPQQQRLLETVCQVTCQRGMATPAILLLETLRPLHFVSAQALHFFHPILSSLGTATLAHDLAQLLEHPGAIAHLIEQLEQTSRGGPPSTPPSTPPTSPTPEP